MAMLLKTSKATVDLKPSRIRRDPTLVTTIAEEKAKVVRWRSSGHEITGAVIGIVLFARALDAIVLGFGKMLAG